MTAALQRSAADLENNRRRTAIDRDQAASGARTEVVVSLLPLLDNLERAFESAPAELAEDNWVRGVLGIRQQLRQYLDDLQLQSILPVGAEFDPATMEAVETVIDSSKKSGTVAAEVVKGYLYRGQVLRPAQVKVIQGE